MPLINPLILRLSERLLRDRVFRSRFFRGRAQDEIAMSILSLRKLRKKRQIDLASEAGMRQSAISRIEQADYGNWTLNTLFRVADVLDARLRIVFDPIEEVIIEYKKREAEAQAYEQCVVYQRPGVNMSEFLVEHLEETLDSGASTYRTLGIL